MNANKVNRLKKAERDYIESLTDEELTAIVNAPSDDGIDVTQLTDAELEDMLNGGPIPARFADCASSR